MFAHHQHNRLQGKKESQKAAAPPSGLFGVRRFIYGGDVPTIPNNPGSDLKFPLGFWIQGKYLESDRRAVAIVGSRKCTNCGAQAAYELSTELAQAGVSIISGLALGIDGFAHRAALKAGGRTVAVLGTGFNHIRPVRHRSLYAEILASGAGVSPFYPDFKGYKDGRNYLQRNAVISALSRVLVVADAQERSGSLAAARGALRQGRPVGLTSALVNTQPWAQKFLMKPGTFIVHSVADVLERVGE